MCSSSPLTSWLCLSSYNQGHLRHRMIRSARPTVKALPERLRISIGGYFGSCYEVKLKKGRLTYTHWPPRESSSREPEPQREEIQPSAKQWQTFRKSLDQLNIWCWREDYPNPPEVCDGTNWSVEIAYTDKAIVSGGSNCFPGRNGKALPVPADEADNTFAKFCCAVASLIGRQFR
jgi:hypothetical protein